MSSNATRRANLVALGACLFSSLPLLAAGQTVQLSPAIWQQPRLIRVAFQHSSKNISKEFLYWQNGQYIWPAYYLLSQMCLDTSSQKAITMDPRLFDLIFLTQTWFYLLSGQITHHIITSAYRTESSNERVGGAVHSQHLFGRALDGHMVGLDLASYAQMLFAFKAGGVGLYRSHVHWDVGRSPRFWQA